MISISLSPDLNLIPLAAPNSLMRSLADLAAFADTAVAVAAALIGVAVALVGTAGVLRISRANSTISSSLTALLFTP